MRSAKIVSTGMCVPKRLVTNEYFDQLYKQDVGTFLREKRNIHQRFYMESEQATSDLVVLAATDCLTKAGVHPEELDLIIVATDTPDFISPSTASIVQYKLKAKNAGCFDVNAACAGFVTALDTGSKFISSDTRYRNILVVGAYGMSKYLDFDDYKIATLFADGAAAVLLQPSTDETGILSSELWADGSFYDAMGIYAGGTAKPITEDVLQNKSHLLKFLRRIPPEFNSTHWPRLAMGLLDRVRAHPQDVKKFFVTQINIDSIHQTMDVLKVSHDKSHNVMDRYGYTGSACIPMALHDACTQHLLKKNDLILMIGSGGGVSMGAVAIRWAYDT